MYDGAVLLQILEKTINDFHTREPGRIQSVEFSMHHVRELYEEFIRDFGPRISDIRGESEGGHFHTLSPLADKALQSNDYVKKIITVLKRTGYKPRSQSFHGGEKAPTVRPGDWKVLAREPDAGLTAIGHLEFRLTTSTLENKAKAKLKK